MIKKRVTFYMGKQEYNKFRSLLLLRDTTASEWLRSRIRRFIVRNDNLTTDTREMAQDQE